MLILQLSGYLQKNLQSLLWCVFTHLAFIQEAFKETAYGMNAAWHSMTLEFQYYMLFPLFLLAMKKIRSPLAFLLIAVVASVTFEMLMEAAQLPGSHFYGILCFSRMGEFCAGMALAELVEARKTSRNFLLALSWASLVVGLLAELVFQERIEVVERQAYVFSAFILLRALGPSVASNATIRFFSWLGRFSYSTFLVHVTVGALFVRLLAKFGLQAITSAGIVAQIGAFIVLGHVAGFLFFLLVERPSTAWARRRYLGRGQAAL